MDIEPASVNDAKWLDGSWPISDQDIAWLGGISLGRAAIWTRMEAVYKMGCGMWGDVPGIGFSALRERLMDTSCKPRIWTFAGGGHVVSVAATHEVELRVVGGLEPM